MVFDKAWNLVKTRGFDIRDHNGEDDNFDILAEILGTDKGDSDAAVDEYERLKDMFDREPPSHEGKLDEVLAEMRNRPPKEGIELPGLVRTGSLEDQVPIDECAGCGLPHGSPGSKYCSEQCESQGSYENR